MEAEKVEESKTLDFQLTNLNKGKGSQGLTALQAPSTHTFVIIVFGVWVGVEQPQSLSKESNGRLFLL